MRRAGPNNQCACCVFKARCCASCVPSMATGVPDSGAVPFSATPSCPLPSLHSACPTLPATPACSVPSLRSADRTLPLNPCLPVPTGLRSHLSQWPVFTFHCPAFPRRPSSVQARQHTVPCWPGRRPGQQHVLPLRGGCQLRAARPGAWAVCVCMLLVDGAVCVRAPHQWGCVCSREPLILQVIMEIFPWRHPISVRIYTCLLAAPSAAI